MQRPAVVIADYGMGNLFSIERAVRYVGGKCEITDNPVKIARADRLILPGVGAFGEGMRQLKENGMVDAIYEFVQKGRPMLGICLGMQLLLSESCEFGVHKGLELIQGKVVPLTESKSGNRVLKIPHIGWNQINAPVIRNLLIGDNSDMWKGTILNGLKPGTHFYFVHSFRCMPEDPERIIAETVYGEDRFCSVVNKDNVWGCQFHPERSGEKGLQVYKQYVTF